MKTYRYNLQICALVITAIIVFGYMMMDNEETESSPNKSKKGSKEEIHGLRKESGVYFQGTPPMSVSWMLSQIKPFLAVYEKRPGLENVGGSKVMHQFALWCLIRHLKPKHIIESGIYKGLGTWIIRQSAPMAQIICLDPSGKTASEYKDEEKNSIYMTGDKFQDFKSVEWSKILDKNKTMVFIDDHQYPVRRLQEAQKIGFKHVVFDDNYWVQSDVFSLKQVLAVYKDKLPVTNYKAFENGKPITNAPALLEDAKIMFDKHVDIYWEFPMMWACHVGNCNTNTDNVNQLLDITDGETLLKLYGLNTLPSKDEINGYYNIAYVKLH